MLGIGDISMNKTILIFKKFSLVGDNKYLKVILLPGKN